jgi:hypothetical protein
MHCPNLRADWQLQQQPSPIEMDGVEKALPFKGRVGWGWCCCELETVQQNPATQTRRSGEIPNAPQPIRLNQTSRPSLRAKNPVTLPFAWRWKISRLPPWHGVDGTSLGTLRSRDHSRITQHSIPAGGQPLPAQVLRLLDSFKGIFARESLHFASRSFRLCLAQWPLSAQNIFTPAPSSGYFTITWPRINDTWPGEVQKNL